MSLLDEDTIIMKSAFENSILTDEIIESLGFKRIVWNLDKFPENFWMSKYAQSINQYSFIMEIREKKIIWFSRKTIELKPNRRTYPSGIYEIEYRVNDIYKGIQCISTVGDLNQFCIKYIRKSVL